MTAEPPARSLRLNIDGQALADNWRALDRLSGTARAGAAVKADCYGLGVAQCVPVLREAGATDFFVAHWSEVAELAGVVDPARISVLHGPGNAAEAAYAREVGVRPVVNSLRQARLWLEAGGGPCDVMVDTGINRLGVPMDEIGDEALAQLDIEVLMSHLACADEDSGRNAAQRDLLREAASVLGHRQLSLANSAGIGLGEGFAMDLTRPGLSLYGGVQRPELEGVIRQVATPHAAILQVRALRPGDRVGYNGAFEAERSMRIGLVSIGYADGFLRCWAGEALRHEGRSLPILGKVSMDMTAIDLSRADDLAEGDWVEVPYHLPHAAEATGLSQYELLTVLGSRFARHTA